VKETRYRAKDGCKADFVWENRLGRGKRRIASQDPIIRLLQEDFFLFKACTRSMEEKVDEVTN